MAERWATWDKCKEKNRVFILTIKKENQILQYYNKNCRGLVLLMSVLGYHRYKNKQQKIKQRNLQIKAAVTSSKSTSSNFATSTLN